MKRLSLWVGGTLGALIAMVASAWAFGALWFDGPFGVGNKLATVLLAAVLIIVLLFVRPFRRKFGGFAALFAGVADLVASGPR